MTSLVAAVGLVASGAATSTAGPPPAPLGTPEPAPHGTGGYALLAVDDDARPVAWDPCREVRYVVRPDGQPEAGAELLAWAFAEVSRATGLRFVAEGTTTERPSPQRAAYQPDRYGERWAPVLVAWSSVAESPELAPDRLGVAGPSSYGDPGARRYVSGHVVLNAPELSRALATGREAWARTVLLHELGHLVGLDHVGDPYQVMHGVNAAPVPSYRDGDRRGLEALGRGPCFTDR